MSLKHIGDRFSLLIQQNWTLRKQVRLQELLQQPLLYEQGGHAADAPSGNHAFLQF